MAGSVRWKQHLQLSCNLSTARVLVPDIAAHFPLSGHPVIGTGLVPFHEIGGQGNKRGKARQLIGLK